MRRPPKAPGTATQDVGWLVRCLCGAMAAGNPAEPELLIEVQALRTTVLGMETSVANAIHNVQQLTIDMRGLLASADQGVYGESYATDSGPAIRARFFERLSAETQEL